MWPWLFGAILLLSGLVIIAFHQYWRSPAAIIVSVAGLVSGDTWRAAADRSRGLRCCRQRGLQFRRNRGDLGGVRLPRLGRAVSDLRRLEAGSRTAVMPRVVKHPDVRRAELLDRAAGAVSAARLRQRQPERSDRRRRGLQRRLLPLVSIERCADGGAGRAQRPRRFRRSRGCCWPHATVTRWTGSTRC